MTLIFIPSGIWTLRFSFLIENAPHVFVLCIFSGSLMVLLGLVGLGGLLMSEKKPPKEASLNQSDLSEENPHEQVQPEEPGNT
jgi:hypothetical protein